MDSTAKILEQMDGTQFEKICGPILQKMIPELSKLIPSGINADGRVIKSLADGFCFIDRTNYATVHITTNTSDLETKWLYNGGAKSTPKGDFIKSVIQAREMNNVRPDYSFFVFLVYNRSVDDGLHIKVNQSNTDEFISVRIIEQRNLVLFLDHNPEGQYLRKHLLGIDAIRISASLLKDIARTNLSRYGEEIYLEESHLANFSIKKSVELNLKESAITINLLIGESGFGKSTLCYAMVSSMLNNDMIALRLKQSIVENAISLKDAIQRQLKSDYTGLFIQEKDIADLFQNALVIIDDINKSDNPTALLDKIISWNEAKQEGSISVLCPVWPKYLNALDNKLQKKNKFLHISLESLSFYDCRAIIQQRIDHKFLKLTDQQIHALIIDTGFDPLLIDFSLQLINENRQYDESVPGEAIGTYISEQVQQLHNLNQTPVYLINKALVLLGKEMLKNRKLDPHLSEIEKWLGNDSEESRLINAIAAHRKLFLFDDEGKIFFRHDRVRDHLLMLCAIPLFNDFLENKEVLDDPYYAEIIGAALAATEMVKESVESLVMSNPLATYVSLKFLQDDSSDHKMKVVIEAIRVWRSSVSIEFVPKTVIGAIASALVGFDTKSISIITQGFPKSAELDLAKFRNGIWLSGINFLSTVDYFYPEAPTYWWNSILAHVKTKYLVEIIKELGASLLSRFTPEGITHAYTLVGFFRENAFLNSLVTSWKKYHAPRNYVAYLWAILNSCLQNDSDIIVEALSYWSTLTAKEKLTRLLYASPVSTNVTQQIKRTHWKFSDDVLKILIESGDDINLHEILSLLFIRIDHPRAMAIVLNIEMKREEKKIWHDDLEERWNPANSNRTLSQATLDYLLQEFSNLQANNMRRYLAWSYWIGNIAEDIALKKMQEIVSSNDSLFEDAVIWRIRHNDHTALLFLQNLIDKKPWLIRLLAKIWNAETKIFFLQWFHEVLKNQNKNHITYALDLLQYLDNDDACKMLINSWEQIKFSQKAIETALFLSSPETRELADKEIKRLGFVVDGPMPTYYSKNVGGVYVSTGDGISEEKKKDLLLLAEQFKYLHLHYGSKYKGEEERLTRTKIESLLPYLTLFDDHSIYDLATKCLKIGAADLCYEKFYVLLDRHLRSRIRFTTKDLKQEIHNGYNELEKTNKVYMKPWIDDPEKAGITPDMVTEVLIAFSREYHNGNAFFIIALVLEHLGTRKDIGIMNNFSLNFENQTKEVNYWKENAIFSIKRRSLN